MYKFIKLALINVLATLLLTACGPSEKDAQQAGFSSVAEMNELQGKGFKNKEEYAKSLGFLNVKEMELSNKNGFKTIDEFAKERGFLSVADFRDALENNIDNPESYKDFLSKKQTESFLKSFITLSDEETSYAYKKIPSSREEDAKQKKAITTLDSFISEHKNFVLTDIVCNAITYKFALADANTPLTCNKLVKIDRYPTAILSAHFELKINKNIANSIGKYYESDKFKFSGTVEKISFCAPFQFSASAGSNCTNVLEINAKSVEVLAPN